VRPSVPAAFGAVLALVLLAGCDWGGDAEEDPIPSAAGGPTTQPLRVTAEVTGVGGTRIAPALRRRTATDVRGLVQRYVEAAFVEGAGGAEAFPGFTPAARELAVADRRVLTAAGLAEVAPRSASASVSVLHRDGRGVGATARLRVRVLADDGARVVLRGRLLLTPTEQGWKVFGYDLARAGDGVAR
jgi:hypothetical protein